MYNLMLDALAKAGYMDKIQELLQEMERRHVEKDRITYSVLYNAYSRQGDDAKAEQLWQEMKGRGVEMDLAGFNGLMHNFARKNAIDRVLDTYKQMQVAGIQPDQGTFSILLECCARDALEFRTETSVPTRKPKDSEATAADEESAGSPESERLQDEREEVGDDQLYVVDEKERQRILQGKRRRMEAVMRTMKKANIKLDSILINSIARCYASLGEIEEMFNVVRFLVEEESIKLVEVRKRFRVAKRHRDPPAH
jgi:pentatricopeptide repeat protein